MLFSDYTTCFYLLTACRTSNPADTRPAPIRGQYKSNRASPDPLVSQSGHAFDLSYLLLFVPTLLDPSTLLIRVQHPPHRLPATPSKLGTRLDITLAHVLTLAELVVCFAVLSVPALQPAPRVDHRALHHHSIQGPGHDDAHGRVLLPPGLGARVPVCHHPAPPANIPGIVHLRVPAPHIDF